MAVIFAIVLAVYVSTMFDGTPGGDAGTLVCILPHEIFVLDICGHYFCVSVGHVYLFCLCIQESYWQRLASLASRTPLAIRCSHWLQGYSFVE